MSIFSNCPYPVLMNAGPQATADVTGAITGHPRRVVIEQAWRAIGPGVEVLSSDDGGPLTRTVKRIIDPLVLRLRANPQYSLPVVTAATAAAMHDLIVRSGPELCFAATWFDALKLERRRLRIRTGNAQELYFPVCFELAVTKGAPAAHDRETAAAVLHDIHQGRDRTAIEVLQQYVASPDVVTMLAEQLDRSWRDVQAGDLVTAAFMAELNTVLGPATSHRAATARQQVWSAVIGDATPYNLGALARVEGAELPWSIVTLGLSSVAPQRQPMVCGDSDSDRPLDRSVVDRVRSTLRRALDRDALPEIPLLCEEEVDRAAAPWGLLSEDKQATLVAGIEVAGRARAVRPIRHEPLRTGGADPGPAAQGSLRPARAALPRRGRPDPSAATAGGRRPRRVRAALPEPAVGATARTRRLAGTLWRRRRGAVTARGRRAVGQPRPPATDQGDAGIAGRRMRLVADSGLWATGPVTAPAPLVAVLEVSGAVLSWTIDEPPSATQITFTDPSRADWLWRVLGESGHVALASAVRAAEQPVEPSTIELTGVDIVPGSVDPLRRLAMGRWLRRWWPASRRDGIPGLDRALLDVEVALLTAVAQDFFTDDTLDSDVAELLAPHAPALIMHVRDDDARIRDLARAGARLADEVGVDGIGWAELYVALDDSSAVLDTPTGRRDDYALAAGAGAGSWGAAAVSRGVASINWGAVPPAIFDAAENTVDWAVEVAGTRVVAIVRAAVIGPDPPTGVPVRVRSGVVAGSGSLDADGHATLPLVEPQDRLLTESAAWDQDWTNASVTIGAQVAESPEMRERVRRWARARLDRPTDPASQAFLAEILAGESAY